MDCVTLILINFGTLPYFALKNGARVKLHLVNEMFSKVPIFIDPISKINVSKSSYHHEKIKMLFSNTYDKLIQGEDNLYKTFEEIFS